MGIFTNRQAKPIEPEPIEPDEVEESPERIQLRAEIEELTAKRERIVGSVTGLPTQGTPERVIADRLDKQLDGLLDKYEQQG